MEKFKSVKDSSISWKRKRIKAKVPGSTQRVSLADPPSFHPNPEIYRHDEEKSVRSREIKLVIQ